MSLFLSWCGLGATPMSVGNDAGEAWIAVKRLEIGVPLRVRRQTDGQAMINGIAQDAQSFIAVAAESQVASQIVFRERRAGMIGAKFAAFNVDCFAIKPGGFRIAMLVIERLRQLGCGHQRFGMIRAEYTPANIEGLAIDLLGLHQVPTTAQVDPEIVHGPQSFRVFETKYTALDFEGGAQ